MKKKNNNITPGMRYERSRILWSSAIAAIVAAIGTFVGISVFSMLNQNSSQCDATCPCTKCETTVNTEEGGGQ